LPFGPIDGLPSEPLAIGAVKRHLVAPLAPATATRVGPVAA
jgi:hypothetical protein